MAKHDDISIRKKLVADRKRITNRNRHARLLAEDPDYHKKLYREWKEQNPDGHREKYRRALEKNPNYNKEKRERQKHKRELGLLPPKKPRKPGKQRKYSKKQTERSRQRGKIRYKKNKHAIVQRVVRRQRERYAADKQYAACKSLRSRMRYALRSQSTKKSARTLRLIGCTAAELASHLESQFLDGMSWGNRSEWHIDHIIPVSVFDLTTEEGQQAAFHYTNLRPLWAHDNRAKSSKPPVEQRRFCFGYVTLADERQAKARKGG